MPPLPSRLLRRCTLAAAAAVATGCGTVTLPSQQPLQILAFDAADRPVTGMACRISNAIGEWTVSTPAIDVPVRRSHSDLQIECRRGSEVAMGTVAARRDGLEQALVPFGSVAVAIDHLTGHLYSYPTVVRLRVGQHLRFEFSTEARAAGLIATVGETMVVDLGGTPAPREPMPEAAAAATPPKPASAARPAKRTVTSPVSATATRAAPAPAPRPTAPVNW
jgi:hypothetical protein